MAALAGRRWLARPQDRGGATDGYFFGHPFGRCGVFAGGVFFDDTFLDPVGGRPSVCGLAAQAWRRFDAGFVVDFFVFAAGAGRNLVACLAAAAWQFRRGAIGSDSDARLIV